MKLTVRRARLSDLQSLVSFAQQEAMEAEGLEKVSITLEKGIQTALDDESIAIYWVLADETDAPVGNISTLREWSNWNAGFYWWIQSLYIMPKYRGKGYLEDLLKTVISEAKRQGALDLRLYAHEDNERALKAYRKVGFQDSKYKILIRKM